MGEQNKEKFYDAETGAEVVRRDMDESSSNARFWCNGKGGFCRDLDVKCWFADGCRYYDGTGGHYIIEDEESNAE